MFSCPRCHARLVRTKTQGGLLFECERCQGRAVGLAVVRRAVAAEQVRSLWQRALADETPSGVGCPACNQAMAEVAISSGYNGALHLDLCTRCQFLWFDPHEFEQLPKQTLVPGQRRELPTKVREAMAIADAKREAEQARGGEFGSESPEEAWKWIPAMLGLPVEHEVHPVRTLPWLTWGLSAVLVLVAVLTFAHLRGAAEQFGFIPDQAWRYGGLTFLTAFFLHGGPIHLLGNLYFLVVFGDNVEDYLGRLRYVCLLLFATILGGVLHMLADPRSGIPCIGASGGISGIIVYYALQFPKARLGLVVRYWIMFRWIYFPAYFALICWLLLQTVTAYLQISGVSNVSALAHFGGAAAGVVAWLVWRKG